MKLKSIKIKYLNYKKDYDAQIDLQNKMEKEKENLTKYLLKLEKMLQNKSKQIIINF